MNPDNNKEWNDKDIILDIKNIISNNKDLINYFSDYICNYEKLKDLL